MNISELLKNKIESNQTVLTEFENWNPDSRTRISDY